MEGLIKFIFYIAILAFWVISNLKKQGNWEEKIPNFPKELALPKKDRLRVNPKEAEPLREGEFGENLESAYEEAITAMTYDELMALRKSQTFKRKEKKKHKKPLEPVDLFSSVRKNEENTETIITAPMLEKKPAFSLSSTVKEGVVWSIILGPPRAKEKFNWKNLPTRR